MKIAFLGDSIFSPSTHISEQLLNLLNQTDFNVLNLEAPVKPDISLPNKPTLFQKTDLQILKKLNVTVVSLANNHIMDLGEKGLKNTIDTLKDLEIKHFGAGLNLQQALNPLIVQHNDKKILFVGGMMDFLCRKCYATKQKPGVARLWQNLKHFEQILDNHHADLKIVFNHWNQEYEPLPEPICRLWAKRIISKADIIIGSHPHVIQPYEQISGKPIFYSLGNFSMPQDQFHNVKLSYPEKSNFGLILLLEISDGHLKTQLIPIVSQQNGFFIDLASPKQAKEILNSINQSAKILENYSGKAYKDYYKKQKIRKLRPILRTSRTINLINMTLYSALYSFSKKIARNLNLVSYLKKKYPKFYNSLRRKF